MLHGLLKQHQVHVRMQFIIMFQRVHQHLLKLLQVRHLCVARLARTVSEVRIDQRLVDEDRLIYALQTHGVIQFTGQVTLRRLET